MTVSARVLQEWKNYLLGSIQCISKILLFVPQGAQKQSQDTKYEGAKIKSKRKEDI